MFAWVFMSIELHIISAGKQESHSTILFIGNRNTQHFKIVVSLFIHYSIDIKSLIRITILHNSISHLYIAQSTNVTYCDISLKWLVASFAIFFAITIREKSMSMWNGVSRIAHTHFKPLLSFQINFNFIFSKTIE